MADKKKTLAEMIRGSVGEASIAAMDAQAVPNPDTGRDRIEYLPLDKLQEDEKNFYSMNGIEELARNIETVGLLDPLVVRPAEDTPGSYRIISGHRRRAALEWLAQNGTDLGPVPCIVKRDDASSELQELRLILANSDTRKMCDADIAKQAERVTELLYRLKEQGFDFPGRMIEYVAEACKISRTKISTLKVIRDKLPVEYRAQFESGEMTTDAAYKIASADQAMQRRIVKAWPKKAPDAAGVSRLLAVRREDPECTWSGADLRCPDGHLCSHAEAFLRHDAGAYGRDQCRGKTCCLNCEQAKRDYYPCTSACARAKKARAEANADKKAAEEKRQRAQQKKDQAQIAAVMRRIVAAMDESKCSAEQIPFRWTELSADTVRSWAAGEFEGKQPSPYSFDPSTYQGDRLRKMAIAIGCSVDYLLELTSDPSPAGARKTTPADKGAPAGVPNSETDAAPQWRTGTPPEPDDYWTLDSDGDTDVYYWDGAQWRLAYGSNMPVESNGLRVVRWYPLPEAFKEGTE